MWLMRLLLEDREEHIHANAAAKLGPANINELVDAMESHEVPPKMAVQRMLNDDSPAVRRVIIDAVASSQREETKAILRDLLANDVESVHVFKRLRIVLVERDTDTTLDHAATTPAWVQQEFVD